MPYLARAQKRQQYADPAYTGAASYAQFGEDLILMSALNTVDRGFYIDVGCSERCAERPSASIARPRATASTIIPSRSSTSFYPGIEGDRYHPSLSAASIRSLACDLHPMDTKEGREKELFHPTQVISALNTAVLQTSLPKIGC
jgi:hypothetical protein